MGILRKRYAWGVSVYDANAKLVGFYCGMSQVWIWQSQLKLWDEIIAEYRRDFATYDGDFEVVFNHFNRV